MVVGAVAVKIVRERTGPAGHQENPALLWGDRRTVPSQMYDEPSGPRQLNNRSLQRCLAESSDASPRLSHLPISVHQRQSAVPNPPHHHSRRSDFCTTFTHLTNRSV